MGEEATTPGFEPTPDDPEGLDQPEDDATEHALRLIDEALRRNHEGRRWLVAGDP